MTRGMYLNNLRRKKGLTQVDAAALVGVHHSTISAYEKDTINIPSDKLEKLAEVYGVSPADILNAGSKQLDVFKTLKLTANQVKLDTGIQSYSALPDQLKGLLATAALEALKVFYDSLPDKK